MNPVSHVSAATTALALALALTPTPHAVAQQPGPEGTEREVIADGVRIDGIEVGGLERSAAAAKVRAKRIAPRRAPLALDFAGRRIRVAPVAVGYRADLDYALRAAYTFGRRQPLRAAMDVPLRQRISRGTLRALLRKKVARLEVPAVPPAVLRKGGRAVVRVQRDGVRVKLRDAERLVAQALVTRTRPVYRLPAERVPPRLAGPTAAGPTAVVIDRKGFRLSLFKDGRRRSFPIAVGVRAHPTPVGDFHVTNRVKNPTWFPPNSPWARGIGPVPPGRRNPLGTRWVGTSAPAIGIHGTPSPSSLGTRASHGCIRMSIPSAEWLYARVSVGTPVLIR